MWNCYFVCFRFRLYADIVRLTNLRIIIIIVCICVCRSVFLSAECEADLYALVMLSVCIDVHLCIDVYLYSLCVYTFCVCVRLKNSLNY